MPIFTSTSRPIRTGPAAWALTTNWPVLEKITPVAARRLPALADLAIARAWAGLYEMTPDAMPIIGPIGGVTGFYAIAGFSGHGFHHALAAGRILADVIAGRDPRFDLRPFAWRPIRGRYVGWGAQRRVVSNSRRRLAVHPETHLVQLFAQPLADPFGAIRGAEDVLPP